MADDTSSERPDEKPPDVPKQPAPEPGPGPAGPSGGPPDEGPPPSGEARPGSRPSGPPPPPPLPDEVGLPEGELPPEFQVGGATKDERTWAMVCHLIALAGLVFPYGSILGPLIVWILKKEESRLIDFHGRQSLWFQIFAWAAVTVLGVLSFPLAMICIGYLTGFVALLAGLGAFAYAVVGAIQISNGKDFEYYWVGPWVRRSMM